MTSKKTDKTAEYLLLPFRVCHTNGGVVAGFSTMQDAEEDAAARNARAAVLQVQARYTACEK